METNNFRNDNRIWTGVFFVAGGFLLLAYKMGAPVPNWIFSWEVLLIAIGILSGIKHQFRNAGWLIMIAVGGIFLVDRQIPELDFHDYLFPVLIIAVGALFIVRPRNCWRNRRDKITGEWKDKWGADRGSWQAASSQTTTDSTDYINSTSIFSGVKRVVLSKNFMGGNITCIMGGAEIDLTQADINGTAIIRFEQVFGGTKIIVPPHWVVNNEIDGIFHGVEDKRRMQPGTATDTSKVLVLRGSCIFGGIDIRSY